MTTFSQELDQVVGARIARNRSQIMHSLRQIAAGNPLGAEPREERMVDRLQAKSGLLRPEAELLAAGIEAVAKRVDAAAEAPAAEAAAAPLPSGQEAIWGSTLDFVGIEFFTRGRRAADAVARVAFRDGRPQGTGWMVAPGLFLTNNHVVPHAAEAEAFCIEFDYEIGPGGETLPVTRFGFDPARCFVFDDVEGLDFTLIGVGPRLNGSKALEGFGYIPLSDASDKHMLGEVANIIQHPQGRLKEVVLRENQLVARDELAMVLHYVADTEPGASGSPVFNNQWEPIALHHWGGPWIEGRDAVGRRREINEGIRISAIVKRLRELAPLVDRASGAAVVEALTLWKGKGRDFTAPAPPTASEAASGAHGEPQVDADGRVTWTIPVELSVRLPGFAPAGPAAAAPPIPAVPGGTAEERRRPPEDFSDRGGYEPGFIPGFVVPLPQLGENHTPARNLMAAAGDDPFELRYHHFSIVMNAERRLAYVTACNIDGASIKAVNRDDKSVTPNPSLRDLGVERLGAERSDDFRPDPRISTDEQMTRPFYEKQNVPGHPDPQSRDRIARMFQKGHIIMRGDPAWGLDAMAVAAERDTFFYTNAAPQVGFFNQGSRLDRPGVKGKLRWRAVETYVLRNAVTMRQRISVFAGPIFASDDPEYRFDSRVPMRFWKVAVWTDDSGGLRSVALVADQSKVLEVMPEGVPTAEAFEDPDEIARVSEFLTTVGRIEEATGLDFGDAVRAADVRRGTDEDAPAIDATAGDLLRPTRRTRRRRS